MKFLKMFTKKNPDDAPARALYAAAVAAARAPALYVSFGLPDTPEGRLESVMLHVWLILHRLKGPTGSDAARVSQGLFDVLFEDMDRTLREMGVGDLGVPRRIRAMAEAFMGRMQAYDSGLSGQADAGALEDAIRRNCFRTAPDSASETRLGALAAYVRAAADGLAGQETKAILDGRVAFAPAREAENGR